MSNVLKPVLWACALTFSLVGLAAGAAPGPAKPSAADAQLPIEAYVGTPRFAQPKLSPDGRLLAVLAPLQGRRNLMLIDLETSKGRVITGMTDFDVVSYHWVGSQRLVYSLGRLDSPTGAEFGDGGGLFTVKADGSDYRKLQRTLREQFATGSSFGQRMEFLAPVPGSDKEILVHANLRTASSRDIYRVDLDSGARKLLTFDQPGHVRDWLLDNAGVPRVVSVVDDPELPGEKQTMRVLIRAGLDAPWVEIGKFGFEDPAAWTPVSFAPNNKDLIVSHRRSGWQTQALYLFDVGAAKLGEVVAAHPRYDIGDSLLRDPKTHEAVGVAINDEQYQVSYFEPEYARLQAMLEAQFPGQAVRLQRSQSERSLVVVSGDRLMPTYYLFDEKAKRLEELLKVDERLQPQHLVQMQAFLLKTRDGLEIPSYYFLPASYQPGQRLPTVVHIHGGPHVRADVWGAVSSYGVKEAQLLASRGYAVVLPNFRITPGFGKKIYEAGYGEFGRKMSDDHEDAANWAVQQGFADKGRICISGASYGGYATLWASIRSAQVFRCGVAGLVVSDLELQLTSTQTDFHRSKSGIAFWKRLLGVKGDDWSRAHEISPARHAERSSIPLFIYAGASDRRTPLEQTKAMTRALEKAGRPAEKVLIKSDEGHGYGKTEHRVELYGGVLEFLARHIGTGPTP